MKKNFKSILVVIILVLSIFPLVIELGSDHSTVESATIMVDDDGEANYTTIQAAINAAIPGDTIEVWAGTYNENLNINKQLNLVGNGSLVTTINAGGSTDGIYVSANSVTISGFTIINSGPVSGDCGVDLDTVDYCTVQDCNITSTFYAIHLKYSTKCLIRNNNCSNNIWGVPVGSSSYYNIIRNNTCNNNDYGISIAGNSENNTVENNICNSNTYMGVGIGGAIHNFIFNNTCLKNDWGVSLSSSANLNIIRNNTCNPNQERGIYVYYYSNNNIIENNNCSAPFNGIYVYNSCSKNKIKNNTCYYSSMGIRIDSGTDSLIENNTCIENSYAGIYIGGSNNNLISNNTLKNIGEYGIYISSSYNINVTNNTMYHCGLFMGGSTVNHWNTHVIDTSNMVNNKPIIYLKDLNGGTVPTGAGQVILANCDNVIVQNQTLSNSSIGILLGHSSNNILFNNTCNGNQKGYGISLHYSPTNLINNNTCNYDSRGIALWDNSDYNLIGNNTCWYGGTKFWFGNGIYIRTSYNRIENNTCSYKESYGINLGTGLYNIVRYNKLSYNERYGIYLGGAKFSTVDNNDCYKNGNGTRFVGADDTMFFDNLISNSVIDGFNIDSGSNNNYFYHNSIIDNANQATDLGGNSWAIWDGVNGQGNYWSDYTGVDDGSGGRPAGDGIGDTNLPHLGLDNFPYVNPWVWNIPEVPVLTDPGTYDSDGTYSIFWSKCNKTLGYALEEDINNTFDSPVVIYNSSNTFCNTNAKPNGTYYYRVKSYNNRFQSAWSNSVEIDVDWPPVLPRNLTVAVYPEGSALNLTWKPNENDTKEYEVYFRTTGSWTNIGTVTHPDSTFNHSGLIDGTQYFYRIRAVDFRDQLSGYTEPVDAVPEDLVWPEPPMELVVTPQSYESLLLTWEPNTEIDLEGYNIYRTTDTSGIINWGDPINTLGLVEVETYLDTGLEELTTYSYIVTALDEVPNESWISNIATGTTLRGPYAPEINNSINDFDIVEDTSDDSSINLFYWFKDVNNDELSFKCEGDVHIEVTIFQENGTVILKPEKNWNGQETLKFYAEDETANVWDEVTVTVTSVNDPPFDVKITKPIDGIEIDDGEPLDFRAEYDDPDLPYGDMLDLEWSSNISGEFANKNVLADIILSIGTHLITFKVTDQESAEGLAYVNVTVLETLDTDSDLDGIPNYWERKYGLDPFDPTDADEDNDHDALSNSDEFELSTDPTTNDTDEDGLSDYDEVNVHLTDPTEYDTDGDGHSDSEDAYPLDSERWEIKSDGSDDGDEDSDDLGLVIGIVIVIIIIIIIIVIILIFLFVLRPRMKKKSEPATPSEEPATLAPVPEPEVQQPLPVQAPPPAPQPVVQQPYFSPPPPVPGIVPQPMPVQQPTPTPVRWEEE